MKSTEADAECPRGVLPNIEYPEIDSFVYARLLCPSPIPSNSIAFQGRDVVGRISAASGGIFEVTELLARQNPRFSSSNAD